MIYLIKTDGTDGTFDTFTNVIEWSKNSITYKAGRGIAKIYAGKGEYFTDQNPEK